MKTDSAGLYSITILVDLAGQHTQRGLAFAWRQSRTRKRSRCQGSGEIKTVTVKNKNRHSQGRKKTAAVTGHPLGFRSPLPARELHPPLLTMGVIKKYLRDCNLKIIRSFRPFCSKASP